MAAFAFVLARTCTRVNPDEAMLTGMMHGIGKLYVLTRATDHPELFADAGTLDEIIREWHPSIGKAILENWEFPEAMAQAVGEQEDHARTEPEAPDLSDVDRDRRPDGRILGGFARLSKRRCTACLRAPAWA